jgi:hypothetical protein
MPAKWRVAESLQTLLKQLNEAFPRRSKASDGSIGDARHQASKSSDHNPHVKLKGQGIVTARDFTHDPQTGIDCQWLADTLVKNKDPRIKYIIWNRQICSSKTSPWAWRRYSGVNAHTKHLHLSVDTDPKLFDSTKPWKLDFPKAVKSDIAKISAASSVDNPTDGLLQNGNGTQETTTTDEPVAVPATAISSESHSVPLVEQPPTEITRTQESSTDGSKETVEVTAKNEQDVNVPAQVTAPEPYLGVGFWPVVKRDLAFATGGNFTFSGLSEYAQQASGWPPWVIGIVTKLAVGALIATLGYFLFRLVHYGVDTWKKGHKTRTEALVNTDINRKDIDWQ